MRDHEQQDSQRSAAGIIAAVEHKQRRWKFGCLALVGGVTALFFIALTGSQRENKDWRAARPSVVTEGQWAQKREMCERISLGPHECAARPDKEVKAMSDATLKRELEKVCADDNPSAATIESQRIVRAALKAPASADFADSSTRTTHDGCIWIVSGEVDAQNSFGAQLRSPYYVKLQRTGKDLWLPLDVRVQ